MPRLTHPQEIEVYYILPALRREIALALKAEGIEQKKIAGLLGVTEAAVSQYMHSKRAKAFSFDEDMKKQIWKTALEITDVNSMVHHTQHLLAQLREKRQTCQACHDFSTRDVPKGCSTCFDTQTQPVQFLGGK